MQDHVKRQIFLIHSSPSKSRLAFYLINIVTLTRSATAIDASQERNTTAPIKGTNTCTAKYDAALSCVAYQGEL
jgi:hypothetical protein